MINVNDILKEKGNQYYAVSPSANVIDALRLMAEKNIGAVLVMENDQLVGIFSERDYARKVVLAGKSSLNTPVSEIMSTGVITVTKETSLNDCMQIMTDKHFRHLPVIEDNKVIGVVSIGDIVSRIIREQRNTIQQLENYIIRG
ncbi:MAG: CBS domain-containing protein [Bacteroidales bacterium]|nr:CBS domain-containing protein [Bacteroidales bacterium]HOK97684.1 CBS domain-containing protein [Bacteroidales bacterium]HPO65407.1 CBS domain-containing protein [Bacteroidales bacterium]